MCISSVFPSLTSSLVYFNSVQFQVIGKITPFNNEKTENNLEITQTISLVGLSQLSGFSPTGHPNFILLWCLEESLSLWVCFGLLINLAYCGRAFRMLKQQKYSLFHFFLCYQFSGVTWENHIFSLSASFLKKFGLFSEKIQFIIIYCKVLPIEYYLKLVNNRLGLKSLLLYRHCLFLCNLTYS